MRPLVSVLVTVYNREAYLAQTLKSILASTCQDFEVIVVDDASNDSSLELARRVASKDERVKVFANESNLGDYPNRAKAAGLAQGRYIKFVDSDDLIYPHSLAIMVESMEKYQEAALGLAHSMPEDESPYPWRLTPDQIFRKHFLGRGCLSCGPSGAIIRRESFESIGGFHPQWGVISDIDLWYRMSSRWSTVLLAPGLVWWRRHQEQEFTKNDAEFVYLDRGYELAIEALTSPECPLPDSKRAVALGRNRQHLARRLLALAFRRCQINSALRIYKNSNLSLIDLVQGFRPYQ